MKWISIEHKLPTKEKYYKCLCYGFSQPIHCKFRKAIDGPNEFSPSYFIHKKRLPYVKYWKENEPKN